jgi:hypothetical protein
VTGGQHRHGRHRGCFVPAWFAWPGAVADELCAEVLGVSGVAVSVLASGGDDIVWRTDGLSVRLDDRQFTLGEGPGVDAAASGELVLEPDLGAVPVQRWPVFTPAALELGVRAVFAVPLQIGAIRVGVLVAQRGAPGLLDGGVLTDLLVFAGAATDALLRSVTGSSEPRWLSGQGSGPLPERLSPAAWPTRSGRKRPRVLTALLGAGV